MAAHCCEHHHDHDPGGDPARQVAYRRILWAVLAINAGMFAVEIGAGLAAGSLDVATGDAIFVQSDRVDIHPGTIGMVGLAAYTGGGPVPHLLQRVRQPVAMDAGRPQDVQVPTSLTQAKGGPHDGRLEITR